MLTGDLLRGHTDAIILSILHRADDYGYHINLLISEISKGTFNLTEATMYTSLKRLEKNLFIIPYWMDGINTKRKYYSITDLGVRYLKEHNLAWENARTIIDKFMEEVNDK